MKRITIILIILFCKSVLAQQYSLEWKRYYNGPAYSEDYGVKIITDDNGFSYNLCRYELEPNVLFLIKYDPDGVKIWRKSYLYANARYEEPVDLRFDNSGKLIIFSNAVMPTDVDVVTRKLDSAGIEIWSEKITLQGTNENCLSTHVDISGNIYLTGITSSNRKDILTVKYSSEGNVVFQRTFNGSENDDDYGYSITTDDSLNVYVAGSTNSRAFESDYVLLKYNRGGGIIWGRFFSTGTSDYDYATNVLVDNANKIIVSGITNAYEYPKITTLQFDTSGNMLWDITYSVATESVQYVTDMRIDKSNNIYLTGKAFHSGKQYLIMVKYDSSGNEDLVLNYKTDVLSGLVLFEFDSENNIYFIKENSISSDTTKRLNLVKSDPEGKIIFDTTYIFPPYSSKDAFLMNGKIYVTGSSIDYANYTIGNIYAACLNLNGATIWNNYEFGSGTGEDVASSLMIDQSGNLYVTGNGSFGLNTSFITLKYNVSGSLLWEKAFNRLPGTFDYTLSSTIDFEGNVILTGYTYLSTSNQDIVTVKYDSNGSELWSADFAGVSNGHDKAYSIESDDAGNIYICGSTTTSTGIDWITIRYSQTGIQQWTAQHSGTASASDYAYDIELDSENNVYVAGSITQNTTGVDASIVKYNNLGAPLWVRTFSSQGNLLDEFRKIIIDEHNNIYACGETFTETGSSDYLLVKFNEEGEMLWHRTYNGPFNNLDKFRDAAIYDDRVYVTGESLADGSSLDFLTIAYDSSGNELWTARYNHAANRIDRPNSITIDKNGGVYVAGESSLSATNIDMAIIKYDSQGNQQWVLQYGDPSNNKDISTAITVNDLKEVFVTGSSRVQSGHSDIITLKYSNTVGIQNVEISYPEKFKLFNCYPNPFNPVTNIKFDIPEEAAVEVKVYDISGKETASIVDARLKAGNHEYKWNADNLASGIYFVRLTAINGAVTFVASQKLVLIR